MIIGEAICELRFRSFYLNGSLISAILVLFLKLSKSGWVSLDIGEGTSRIQILGGEPVLLNADPSSDEFVYPIQASNRLDEYFGKELISLSEYRIADLPDCCVGLYFDFLGAGFSVLESDDSLVLIDGIAMIPGGPALLMTPISP